MDLDCSTGRILALALISWVYVSIPIGLALGAFIHRAQHGPPAALTSDISDNQA